MLTRVNLNPYADSGSRFPWHSDNESFFFPQNQRKLIVSQGLGNSVEIQVRRTSGGVPSPIQLDHGDLLVMDGLAQSKYVHRTVSGLQGPRVNLTYRWVTQHTASCPQTGALPAYVQSLAEPGFPQLGKGRKQMVLFLSTGPPLVNLGVSPPGTLLT